MTEAIVIPFDPLPRRVPKPVPSTGPVRRLMEGLSRVGPGEEYFRAVAREVAETLGVELAFVAEVIADEPARARTIALYADGAIQPNLAFDVDGTPCRELFEARFCCYPRRVQECFPRDLFLVDWNIESYAGARLVDATGALLGWMAMLSRRPISDPAAVRAAMCFLSDRTSAELQRRHCDEALRTHDPLTRLPNRARFLDRVDQALARGDELAVLLLDVDRFKVVNDSLGHRAGDELFCALARRVRDCTNTSDVVARFSGDELAILIGQASEAVPLAERILAALARPFIVAEQEVYASASIGIAMSATGYARADDVLRDADTAMECAKELGRGRYAVFDLTMHRAAVRRLETEMDLRRALERDELRVVYQPIVSLTDGRINGYEALVRWEHPTRGLVMPADFIPIAEETGVIVPLGMWVLRHVCEELPRWGRPVTISVNLSLRQLRDPRLAQQIGELVRCYRVRPGTLRLEVTESAVIDDAAAALETFSAIRALGIELCIDDFGTGYSALSHLVNMPFDALKIDRSFIARMQRGDGDELVKAIVALAHNLGVTVIAEGVETHEQLERLTALRCDLAQGYLLGRPSSVEEWTR